MLFQRSKKMLSLLFNTLLTAFPFLLPIVILLIAKKTGFRYKQQRPFFIASFVFYGLALAAFAAHAVSAGGGAQEFFRAYYGSPVEKTMLCYGGFLGQGLAVVALLFVVNWSTVELFFMKPGKQTAQTNKAEDKTESKTEATPEESWTETAQAESAATAQKSVEK